MAFETRAACRIAPPFQWRRPRHRHRAQRRLKMPRPPGAIRRRRHATRRTGIAVTREVRVTVRTYYLADQSEPGPQPLCLGLPRHHRQ